jgi:conjugal transfer mating pair stabilization protein TraG
MIVGRILEQYAAEACRRFGRVLVDPAATMGRASTAEFSMPQVTPRPQGRRRADQRPAMRLKDRRMVRRERPITPGEDAARAAIQRGATEVLG